MSYIIYDKERETYFTGNEMVKDEEKAAKYPTENAAMFIIDMLLVFRKSSIIIKQIN
jgi:hypothetical protein